jgi:TetR/AcrR family transcriptional regulator, cholesterol catabolism regulator
VAPKRSGIETRDAIQRAAVEVFAERGYPAASVREIAGRLGIKAGSLYNHYPSKQDILFAIMSDNMARLVAGFDECTKDKDPEEALRSSITHHVLFHRDNAKAAFVADSELRSLEPGYHKKIVEVRKNYEHAIQRLIEDGQRAKVFRPGPASVLSYAIITACSGVATWFRPTGAHSIGDIADTYADLFLRGLKIGQESRPRRRR